jgi:intracellular sulfur oxidation DsrE/DsrF family protein
VDRDFEVKKTLNIKNVEIAICEITIQSQSLNEDHIWTVDLTPYRSFANRDMERQRKQCNKNVEIAICKITIHSQSLNQNQI